MEFVNFSLLGGSKLLDGTWTRSAETPDSDLCSDGGRCLFELFHDDDVTRSDRSAASSDTNPPSEQSDPKYYTPFGSGVSLGDLTCRPLSTESGWNTEPSKSHSGVIGKPLPVNGISTDKFPSVAKLSCIGTKAASKQIEGCNMTTLLGHRLVQSATDRNVDKSLTGTQPQNCRQKDSIVHQGLSGSFSDHRAGNTPSPKLTGIPGDGKCISAEHREKQILATQQMFMHELNRLPPDLRKQYVDYMLASRLGVVPGACPAITAVPSVYYNVAVSPGAVPITPVFAQPVILPAGPIMPTPLVTLQPVVPSPVTKSVSR